MDTKYLKIQAEMEQRSSRLRDSREPVPVPEMDLFLLVNMAQLGIDAMLGLTATSPESKAEIMEVMVARARRMVSALDQNADAWRDTGVRLAADTTQALEDRYRGYDLTRMPGVEDDDDA